LLFKEYEKNLNHKYIKIIGQSETKEYKNSCWLITVLVEKNKNSLIKKLRRNGIEAAQVHYRNDRYSIFGKVKGKFDNMDKLEDKYLVLPLYPRMKLTDVKKICKIINSGW
jgi:dTDP-4-amino-4,6-dideoxygalactose transaminase